MLLSSKPDVICTAWSDGLNESPIASLIRSDAMARSLQTLGSSVGDIEKGIASRACVTFSDSYAARATSSSTLPRILETDVSIPLICDPPY